MKYEQSFCKAVGDYGCYALCIINIAEEITGCHCNTLLELEYGIDKGYIIFNRNNYYDPGNFDVLEPAKFLAMMVGGRWSVRKSDDILYKPQQGEYVVERWERNGYGHFARTRAGYNSLQDSKCVTLGKLASLRIFKREG